MIKRKNILLVIAYTVVLDVLLAYAADSYLPFWRETYPTNDHRLRSETHHHDIAPMREIVEAWGPVRYSYATNALGFKDAAPRAIDLARQKGRWLLLGDSFTEGIGFDFPTGMAGQIAGQVACKGIEVLNAGVGGYAPSVYWRKARHLIETVGLKTERVVVFIDISDIRDEIDLYPEDSDGNLIVPDPEPPSTMERFGHFLRDHSLTARVFTLTRDRLAYVRKDIKRRYQTAKAFEKSFWQIDNIDMMEFATVPHKASRWTYDDEAWAEYGERGRAKATANMDRLSDLLKRHGIALTVAVYPWPDQIFKDPQAVRHQDYWHEWAKNHDAQFVSLFPAFTEGAPRETLARYFIPGDFHWNAEGHRLAAKAFLAGFDPKAPLCE